MNEKRYQFTLNVTCQANNETYSPFPGVLILPEYKKPSTEPLKARIPSVSNTGLLHIRFNREVNPIANWTIIEEDEVLIDDEPHPVLRVRILPGEFSRLENLYFEWKVVNFTG